MCYWPLPDDGRTKAAHFPLSWQRIFFQMKRSVPVGLLWFFTAPFFLTWAQSDTLNAGADSLYIIINNKIEARLAVNDSLSISRYTQSGLYATDSIRKDSGRYLLYLHAAAFPIDSLVINDRPPLPRSIKRYILRHYPRDYASFIKFLQTTGAWKTNGTSLLRINGRHVLFIKGGYAPEPAGFSLELRPMGTGRKWQFYGRGQLVTPHPLVRSGTMELEGESGSGFQRFSYRHRFRFIGGTPWSHSYRFGFRKQGRSLISLLHAINGDYQYGPWRAGTGIWRHHVVDSVREQIDWYLTVTAQVRHPAWGAFFQSGWNGRTGYFASAKADWKTPYRCTGEHHLRGFLAADTVLVADQWPRDWEWIRTRYPLGKRIKAFGDVYSTFPLTRNEQFLYVFQHFYAIREQSSAFYSIFTLGLGISKRNPKYGLAMEVFYPVYSNYPTDLKEFMFTFKWIDYW